MHWKLIVKSDTRMSLYVVFSCHFNYLAAGIEMEDYLPKTQVLPDELERNRGVEVEGIRREMVIIVDTLDSMLDRRGFSKTVNSGAT